MVHECDGSDHRLETYAVRDRRLLEQVEAFNRRLVAGFAGGRDLTATLAALDPDPARYTWVDEGGGLVGAVLADAEAVLAAAPVLPGFRCLPSAVMPVAAPSARPAVATGPDGSLLVAWVEWFPDQGERVVAVRTDASGSPTAEPQVLSGPLGDCLRPSVAFDGDGAAWVLFGLRPGGAVGAGTGAGAGAGVGVWAAVAGPAAGARFGEAELVSTSPHPSFNQEVARRADGRLVICWQGWAGGRFTVLSRTQARAVAPDGPAGGSLGPAVQLSDDGERNVWDPTVAAGPDGQVAYAWTTYGEGGYRTVVLHGDGVGAAGSPGALGSPGAGGGGGVGGAGAGGTVRTVLGEGGAYSLHPSLTFGADGALWCATDVVALGGHGGSGPTRLRPRAELASPRRTGFRPDGRAVPGDLSPDVTAEVVVVRLDGGRVEGTGPVGTGAPVSPSGLPRLATTASGRVAVTYRTQRRLPLMLYYWDTVVEWHGPAGWEALSTFDEADGPLEEPGIVAAGEEVVVCWQEDGRRDRELEWTEGFGGEECLRRRDHYGEVVWHTLHTGGRVRIGRVTPPAPAPGVDGAGAVGSVGSVGLGGPAVDSIGAAPVVAGPPAAPEARPWAAARHAGRPAPERYHTDADGRAVALYWGDLHRHSLISRCTAGDEPELDDFYRYAFDVCEYDFWAVTDHAENTSPYQWWSIQKLADVLHVPDRFVPFYGFEWTSATGHQNVVFESVLRGAPIYSSTAEGSATPAQLWAHLRGAGQRSLTIPHHPGSAMVPFDWSYHDEGMMRLVEVFQACRGNYEADGCFRQFSDGTLSGTFVQDGLLAGHRFGLIGSSDHGNGAGYVGAYAEALTREAIFDALHARRTMAATTRDVVVDARLDGTFMGGVAAPSSHPTLAVRAQAYGELARVEVVTPAGVVRRAAREPEIPPGQVAVPLRVEWSTGETSHTDWSGRLRVEGGTVLATRYWSPEIVDVTADGIAWKAETRNFRSQYGAQRGGVELTVIGPPDAVVRVDTAAGAGAVRLGDLAAPTPVGAGRVELARGEQGTLMLQRGTGGLLGLGTDAMATSWELDVTEPTWVYVRVILEDGEMAWSSPIWVAPPA